MEVHYYPSPQPTALLGRGRESTETTVTVKDRVPGLGIGTPPLIKRRLRVGRGRNKPSLLLEKIIFDILHVKLKRCVAV